MESLLPNTISSRIKFIQSEIVTNDTVDNWFLMPHSSVVFAIVISYLAFIKYIGPKYMENRKPYNLKYLMLAYNLFQTIYNAYIVSYLFSPGVIPYLFKHSCTPLPQQSNPLWIVFLEASWFYYISKIVDLLDTIFFVLRKKQSHITFLHVYHHAMMVLTCWAYLRYFKGEQGVFMGVINSFVHVVMYSYYFLAALGPSVQKYLWWKKYITKFQLFQFGMIVLHQLGLIMFNCKMPKIITYHIAFQASVMCILFGNFYYQAYIKVKPNNKIQNKSSKKVQDTPSSRIAHEKKSIKLKS